MDIIVVGAGLAGLTAARHLAKAGHDVQLFEAGSDPGGRVRSRTVEGFTLDRGFQVLFTAYPAVQRELDLDALDLRTFQPGATVANGGRRDVLVDPLRRPTALFDTLGSPMVRLGDAARLGLLRAELRRRPIEDIFPGSETSIREYLTDRGFSRRFIEEFLAPWYGGITLDRSLSTASAVFEYTYKAMAAGEIAVPANGMGAIADQLLAQAVNVGTTVRTETTVMGVESVADGATVSTTEASHATDAVVIATDPPTAADLTGLESIPTAGRGCVTQWFSGPRHRGPMATPRLVLNADTVGPNHVAPLSAVAPSYANGDRGLMCAVHLGDPPDSEDTLVADTRASVASWYPDLDSTDLDHLATDRIPFAQFAQPPGIHHDLPATDAPDGPGVLAGEYTEWSSIQGALASGRRAADHFVAE